MKITQNYRRNNKISPLFTYNYKNDDKQKNNPDNYINQD